MNSIGENIRKIRESKAYSQEYVAEQIQISQSAYCKMECGKQYMRIEHLMKLSVLLEVPPESLLTTNEQSHPEAIETIHEASTPGENLKVDLIDHLKNENKRLSEQNNSLISFLKKYLLNLSFKRLFLRLFYSTEYFPLTRTILSATLRRERRHSQL